MEIPFVQLLKIIFAASILFDVLLVVWVLIVSKVRGTLIQLYCTLFLLIILWEVTLWLEFFLPSSYEVLFFIDRLDFALGALALLLSFNFIWYVTHGIYFSRYTVVIVNVVLIALSIVCFIPGVVLVARTYTASHVLSLHLQEGPLLLWYYLFLAPLLIMEVYMFARAYRTSRGIEKIRLKYIGIGYMISVALCMVVSVFFPIAFFIFSHSFDSSGSVIFNTSQIISGISTSFFSLFTVYAITRYRFMDIRVMLRKSIVYGIGLVMSIAAYIVLCWFLYQLIRSNVVWIFAIILLALAAEKYRKGFKHILDGIFFLDELDISKRVEEGSERINSTKKLDEYVVELVHSIEQIVPTKVQRVYMTQRQHHRFIALFSKNSIHDSPVSFVSFDDDIMPLLYEQRSIIVAEELRQFSTSANRQLLKFFAIHQAEVLCMIRIESKILALIFLEAKTTQEPFTVEDTERLQDLIDTTKTTLPIMLHWYETLEGIKLRM